MSTYVKFTISEVESDTYPLEKVLSEHGFEIEGHPEGRNLMVDDAIGGHSRWSHQREEDFINELRRVLPKGSKVSFYYDYSEGAEYRM